MSLHRHPSNPDTIHQELIRMATEFNNTYNKMHSILRHLNPNSKQYRYYVKNENKTRDGLLKMCMCLECGSLIQYLRFQVGR